MRRSGLERATTTVGGGAGEEAEARRGFIGVPGLDELLPAGLTYDTQIMVTGETGVGKSVLAGQFLYEGLLVGDACVYVACDEAPNTMRFNMANLRLGTVAYERAGRLVLIDAFGGERSTEAVVVPDPRNLDEYFSYEREVIERFRGASVRLVVDSLSTIFGTVDRNTVLEFNRDRLRYLSAHRVLALDNYVTGLLDEQTMAGLGHSYPLIVQLGYRITDGELRQRYFQLGKMRSGMFSGERRTFRIDPHAGIVTQR